MNPPLAIDARLLDFPPLFPARVVSRHRHVLNLAPEAAADCLFSLSDDSVPRAPRQMRFATLPAPEAAIAAWQDAPRFACTLRVPPGRLQESALQRAWQALCDAAVPASDDFQATVQQRLHAGITALLQALARGEKPLPVNALIGLGQGLTPSGDDFLCGLLVALHLPQSPFAARLRDMRAAVLAALGATHAVSAAFLRDAAAAEVGAPLQDFLDALGGTRAIAPAIAALTALGQRSGYDILSGILAALPHSPDRRVDLCPCIAV